MCNLARSGSGALAASSRGEDAASTPAHGLLLPAASANAHGRRSLLLAAVFCLAGLGAQAAEIPATVYARASVVESADSDDDGLPDATEARYGTDKLNPDSDGDGLADGDEAVFLNTDPLLADSDGDGWSDGLEVGAEADPMDRLSYPVHLVGETVYGGPQTGAVWVVASPDPGTGPGARMQVGPAPGIFRFTNLVSRVTWRLAAWRDVQADGIQAPWEPWAGTDDFAPTGRVEGVVLALDDGLVDSDGNGLVDWLEFFYFGRLGVDGSADTDGDGLTDGYELLRRTHPLLWDTDGDGRSDGYEVGEGLDPLAPDPPIVLTLALRPEQGTLLEWNTVWSRAYMPQWRESLTTGSWSNLLPAAVYEYDEHPEGLQRVLDRGSRTAPTRFYRVLRVD